MSVDAVAVVAKLGRGAALLAKTDVEAAHHLIPVHPQDRVLQAVQWEDKIYVHSMLPFGLRSALKIFNAITDALERVLRQQGVTVCEHYLDDFLVAGATTFTCLPAGIGNSGQSLWLVGGAAIG